MFLFQHHRLCRLPVCGLGLAGSLFIFRGGVEKSACLTAFAFACMELIAGAVWMCESADFARVWVRVFCGASFFSTAFASFFLWPLL